MQDSPPAAGRLERHLPFRRFWILPGRACFVRACLKQLFLLFSVTSTHNFSDVPAVSDVQNHAGEMPHKE